MSTTVCVAPIIAALQGSEDILGRNRIWRPKNPNQARIVELLKKRDELKVFFKKVAEGGIEHKELRYWVDWIAANLNKILVEEGFDIQLEDFGRNEFGVVSILDVLVEWLMKGEEDQILVRDVAYPAVRMNAHGKDEETGKFMTLCNFFTSRYHRHPIGELYTKSGDRVYMSLASTNFPLEGFELYNKIEGIRSDLQPAPSMWEGMIFPMVDINDQPDISWLVGMQTTDKDENDWEISQALQQTKFKMNQFGARVKSAVAMGFRSLSMDHPQWLMIDRPFYLWIERDGVSFPVVGMYVDYSDWKDPGNLQDM